MSSRAVDSVTSSAALADGSIALALRERTRGVHKRLEHALPLTEPDLTVAAYRVIVEAFYGFYAPLEVHLAAVVGLPIHGRTKVWRLRADLRALGASESRVEALPRCASLPDVTTLARALGCLYVLEGATLGGRVIVRALGPHLDIGPATGAAFFEGYGAETGSMWRSFLAHVNASRGPLEETLAAAVDTFSTFERWLAAQGALR